MYQIPEEKKTNLNFQRTLAGEYVIDICNSSKTWKGYLLDLTTKENGAIGTKTISSLYDESENERPSPSFVMSTSIKDDAAFVEFDRRIADDHIDSKFIETLSRIMIQSIIKNEGSNFTVIKLPNTEAITITHDHCSEEFISTLFEKLMKSTKDIELSEMVSQEGEILGIVPRKLVHVHNLLHRGIGVFVTKDRPIMLPNAEKVQEISQPELFVHRRTDTKRIFPSLYDMFVGGVSIAGEDAHLTASREVAEELGLKRALSDRTMLSEPLFNCTICTSYNRCFVTVFCCSFLSSRSEDSIELQKEEVAWGDFVKYDTVVASADLSIQRLIEKGEYPGSASTHMSSRVSNSKLHEDDSFKWREWDYVPDGLLVWEAWLKWQNDSVGSSQKIL